MEYQSRILWTSRWETMLSVEASLKLNTGTKSLCHKWPGKRKGENGVQNLIRLGDEYGGNNLGLGLQRKTTKQREGKSGKRICTVWSGGGYWAVWGILETGQWNQGLV